MINRRFFMHTLSAFGFSVIVLPIAFRSNSLAASAIAALDKDNDGTLDIDEVKDGATSVFDKLEKDADGTLDFKEAGRRLSKKEFKEADADHDGTLTKDEYLALVEKRFRAADTDADGTLTAKELHSKAGRALLRLIR
jgi:Ca2+-binding EF-hand superfamily protein